MDADLFYLHADVEERHWWFVGRRRIMRRLVERAAPPGRGHTVVDVGCGTGANVAALAGDYRAVGVDPTPEGIDEARRRFPDVEFHLGLVPAVLDRIEGPVSTFLLMDVLEHVPDDFELLSTLVARTPPGGHVLVTVPADMRLWSPHDVAFQHYRRYDPERLAAVWEGLPVRVRLLSHFCARLFPVTRVVRELNRRRGRTRGVAGTDLALPSAPVNAALTSVFAGEAEALLGSLDRRGAVPYPFGSSLVALLERTEGDCEVRKKPAGVAADPHDPHDPHGARAPGAAA